MFEPIKNEKIYKTVMRQVRNLIEGGDLSPGDRLPPERELAAQLSVSRSSVRQAIAALEAQGMLTQRQGDGTYVTGRGDADSVIESLSRLLADGQISPDDILETRMIIECATTRLCTERATEEHIGTLTDLLENNRIAEGRDTDLATMNRDLHIAIAQGANNEALLKVMEVLLDMMSQNTWPKIKAISEQREQRIELHLRQHERIVEAISLRNAELAYHSMKEHLETIEHEIDDDFSTR